MLDFNISICSYNVYWKIMKNDPSLLTKSFSSDDLNIHKSNLLTNIYLVKNYYNPFFYCFQESENYSDIITLFEKSKFKYHIGYSKPEYILTIWNSILFKKKIVIDYEFESGRPFSLFVFKDLRYKKYFVLINIHSGHHHDTKTNIFDPIQQIINSNKHILLKFNIKRIIISGDFNRDIGSQITIEPTKYFLIVNSIRFDFIPYITTNKTCCSLKGYGWNKNYDQLIDSYTKPIIIHQLNKEPWYLTKSSDHLMILSIVKNFI